MFKKKFQSVSEVILSSISEEEYAEWLHKNNLHVLFCCGHYWKEPLPGFYRPVHWLGRLKAESVKRPKTLCWGYRAVLSDQEQCLSNATLPVHLLADLRNYDLLKFPSNRKRKLNRYLHQVEVVEILDPAILYEQGYRIFLSAYQRNKYGKFMSYDKFRKTVERYFMPKGSLILGCFVDGQLQGYTVNEIIEETAYSVHGVFNTDGLTRNIATCLDYCLIDICRRSGIVSEITLGLSTPERPTLIRYKEEMGFEVVNVPAKVWITPVMRAIMKKFYPYEHFRLTGDIQDLPST